MKLVFLSRLTNIGSDNGLSPGWRQAIIWTNTGIFFIQPFRTNFSRILIEIYKFSFKKMHLKMSSAKMASILSQPQWVKIIFLRPFFLPKPVHIYRWPSCLSTTDHHQPDTLRVEGVTPGGHLRPIITFLCRKLLSCSLWCVLYVIVCEEGCLQ